MFRIFFIAFSFTLVVGCSSKQAQQLGLVGGDVNGYAQNMSNEQLCGVYLNERASNQTRVAIAAEWKRRKLSHAYCEEKANELYATKFAKWLTMQEDAKK
ncbi:hypothetical protein [Photobacterium leiognathi]|uniref:hypothetical protein n=1 Tax=Photobacterium leiognathi TaxID=553611 RepID=UPI002739A192|nr:hypothetical protein [Photobacterium leiognathi]